VRGGGRDVEGLVGVKLGGERGENAVPVGCHLPMITVVPENRTTERDEVRHKSSSVRDERVKLEADFGA
jgi:hypothetical protein